ncbi:MAG: NADH-quinone oxidoreductase subunit F, partial [Dehalococcoidales bacterium]
MVMNNMKQNRIIYVCRGTGCVSGGGDLVYESLQAEVEKLNLRDVEVGFTGCHGFCQQGPNVIVEPDGIFYTQVEPEDAVDITASHLRDGNPVERLYYHDPVTGEAIPNYSDIKFYEMQERIVLRNCGHINPEKIEDYLERGGYKSLRKVLFQMTPEGVIEEIKNSGLRGRGGAGFSTGTKWEFERIAVGSPKYAICNADEGDPGAFMDRSILEADPHAVIEGLTIGAY